MRWLIALSLLSLLSACSDDAKSERPIDAAIDGKIDECLTCALGQICVASYDGLCNERVECVPKTLDCAVGGGVCSAECQEAYCASPYQCRTPSPCPGENKKAFICRGP